MPKSLLQVDRSSSGASQSYDSYKLPQKIGKNHLFLQKR